MRRNRTEFDDLKWSVLWIVGFQAVSSTISSGCFLGPKSAGPFTNTVAVAVAVAVTVAVAVAVTVAVVVAVTVAVAVAVVVSVAVQCIAQLKHVFLSVKSVITLKKELCKFTICYYRRYWYSTAMQPLL